MIASAIRSLACGRESPVVAAAFFERTIQVWDIESCRQVSQFDTVYDFGGEIGRLAISPSGDRCVCAARSGGTLGGVACYQTTTGQVIWHRPELKQTQRVSFSPSGAFVWWMPETGLTKRLDSMSGEPERTLRGAQNVFEDRYSMALFIVPRNKTKPYLFGESSEHRLERRGFGVLDVVFASDCFCVTEASGPTRCFGRGDGRERWRYDAPSKSHVVQLHFDEALYAFFGILYNFNDRGRSLIRLDPTRGTCTLVCDLRDSWAFCFCDPLALLVTSSGPLVGITDGREVGRLDFPRKEYPDSKTH